MNEVKRLKVFAIIATMVTAIGTIDIAYARSPDFLIAKILIVGGAVIMLDGGFWLFDSLIPKSRDNLQKNLFMLGLGLWWVMMALTNVGSFMKNFSATDFSESNWGWLAGYVVVLVALIFLAFYQVVRWTDPEMKAMLEEILYFSDIETMKRQNIRDYYKRHGASIAREMAEKELSDSHYQKTGEEVPFSLPEVEMAFSGDNTKNKSPKEGAGKKRFRPPFRKKSL